MIEQIAALLAGIIAKEKAGRLVEAQRDVDALCVQTIGLDLAGVKAASPEGVAQRLCAMGGLRHARAITLAELLLHEAENRTEGDGAVRPAEVHAFCLLADSITALSSDDQSHYRRKLEVLARRIGPLRGHPYIRERLHRLGLAEDG